MIEKYTEADFSVSRNLPLYYSFLDIANSVDEDQKTKLNDILASMRQVISVLQSKSKIISGAAADFMEETRQSTKINHSMFTSLDKEDESMRQFNDAHLNFVVLVSEVVKSVTLVYEDLYGLGKNLMPPPTMTMSKRIDKFEDANQFMSVQAEIQLNGGVLEQYIKTIAILRNNDDLATKSAQKLYHVMESYYKMLMHRHTVEGVKIFRDAVITDVALRIFENIDSHGEIESGKDTTKVSAYTIRKAETLTKAIKDDMLSKFITDPNTLVDFISESLSMLEGFMMKFLSLFEPQVSQIFRRFTSGGHVDIKPSELLDVVVLINEVSPLNVSYSEPVNIKSESEILVDDIRNETIEILAQMLLNSEVSFIEVVQYVLHRKLSLKKFFHDENSFYTCKIGEGNTFTGQAPGALEVLPSVRPRGNMDNILGSGFDEVREFAESIKSSAKWHDLFMATSPSGSADKSNVLLIGPAGCGKTEVMRSIGASKDSIGVFAQGSDFMTCWKGESDKNVKRLFEAGIKLNRESGKHVHFLIDEIDAVLNDDRGHGEVNLTLEFQILMDGVVAYPNLSIWGATNNPERIPIPMIRRFSKVLIVGELNQDERVKLLKHFLGHMPLDNIDEAKWQEWGRMLEGATGDVIRKIADYLWRTKMNKFVGNNPTDAEVAVRYLNSKGKFSIDNFDRSEFKTILGNFITVSTKDIQMSVNENLSNISVITEIKSAVHTYSAAKIMLNKMDMILSPT